MITPDPNTNSEALQVAQSAPTTALDDIRRVANRIRDAYTLTEAENILDIWNKAQVDKAVVEAYKKGYIDGGIGVINETR